MEVIAPSPALRDLFAHEGAAMQALRRFLYDKGPAHFYVQQPFPPLDLTRPMEDYRAGGDLSLKRHVIQFDRRTRDTVYLLASKEAMADIAEWAKAE